MEGLKVFQFIFVFAGIFIPGCFLANMFIPRDEEGALKNGFGFLYAGIAAIIAAVFCAVLPTLAAQTIEVPALAFMSTLILLTIIAMFVGLIVVWYAEGSRIGEVICAVLVALMLGYVLHQAANAVCVTLESQVFLQSLVKWIVPVTMISTIGFILWNWCWFHYKKLSGKKGWLIGSIVTLVVTGLLLISTLWIIKWSTIGDWQYVQKTPIGDHKEEIPEFDSETAEPEGEEDSHYAFFNPSLQYDDDRSNDFNFGYDPFSEVTEGEKDAAWFDRDFRRRFAKDPALLAADAAYLDFICGTRYIGVFYDSAQQDWAQAINDAKDAWVADKMLYFASIDAFNAFLDSAEKVEIMEAEKTEDQFFMNPYTIDGIPDVIVMKSKQKGHYLVYTFIIKGEEKKVAYRIQCGYQPTNVSKGMGIKPSPTPVPPTASGNNYTGSPDPEKKKDPVKDKTKGTKGEVVAPNDNPGPGPDTNNPDNPDHSKVEETPNSTEVKTYDEYKEIIEEKKKINEQQKTDKDPSTPSTPIKPGVNVYDNADKLPDKNAKKPDEAKTSDGKITNDEDDPSGEWDGPKD